MESMEETRNWNADQVGGKRRGGKNIPEWAYMKKKSNENSGRNDPSSPMQVIRSVTLTCSPLMKLEDRSTDSINHLNTSSLIQRVKDPSRSFEILHDPPGSSDARRDPPLPPFPINLNE